MKSHEFITEVKIDVPNQMVTIQVPLKDVMDGTTGEEEKVVNPGKRTDSEGNYVWSSPLQQQLDTAKDAVGTSNDETNEVDAEIVAAEEDPSSVLYGEEEVDPLEDLKKKVAAVLGTQG